MLLLQLLWITAVVKASLAQDAKVAVAKKEVAIPPAGEYYRIKSGNGDQDEQAKVATVKEEETIPPADDITAVNQETEKKATAPPESKTVDVHTTAPKEEKEEVTPAREAKAEESIEAVTKAKPFTTTETEETVTSTTNDAKEEVTTPSKDDATPVNEEVEKRTAGPITEAVTDGGPTTTTEMEEKVMSKAGSVTEAEPIGKPTTEEMGTVFLNEAAQQSQLRWIYENLAEPKFKKMIRYVRKDGTVVDHLISMRPTTYSKADTNCRMNGMVLGLFEDTAEASFVISNYREKYGVYYWENMWRGSTPQEDSKLVRRISDAMRSRFKWYSTGRGGYYDEKCPVVDKEYGRLLETGCFLQGPIRKWTKSNSLCEVHSLGYLAEKKRGYVCSDFVHKLDERPKPSAPDTRKEGVLHVRRNGTAVHFHIVTVGRILEKDARKECAKIGYELGRFANKKEEKNVLQKFRRRHCKFCRGSYWVDWAREEYSVGSMNVYKWVYNDPIYTQDSTIPRGEDECQILQLRSELRKTVSCSRPSHRLLYGDAASNAPTSSRMAYENLPKPKFPQIIRYVRKDGTVMDHLVFDEVHVIWRQAYQYCKKNGMQLGSFEDEDESSFVMITHNRKNCDSYCDMGSIWRGSTAEEDSKIAKLIARKLKRWSSIGQKHKQNRYYSSKANCPAVAMSGYLGKDICLLYSHEEKLGFVCSEETVKLASRPKPSAPDTSKEGVIHNRENGTAVHFHVVKVVTGRVTSEKVARYECAEIGYQLARFIDASEEQFVMQEFQRQHCPYCLGAYRVDHGPENKCQVLSFRRKSRLHTKCKRPTARKSKPARLNGYICSKVLGQAHI
ncbi:hypothetical protein Aduo_004178 [Ancylostoma duodenale]